jgi:hypothetical protein
MAMAFFFSSVVVSTSFSFILPIDIKGKHNNRKKDHRGIAYAEI